MDNTTKGCFSAIIVLCFSLIILVRFVLPEYIDQKLQDDNRKLSTQVATLSEDHQKITTAMVDQQSVFTATIQTQTGELEKTNREVAKVVNTVTAMAGTATANHLKVGTAVAIGKTATVESGTVVTLKQTATSVAQTATAMAPLSIRLKKYIGRNLFDDELVVINDGYSSVLSKQQITLNVRGKDSDRKVFEGQTKGSVIVYEGIRRYTIMVTDIFEEQGEVVVDLVINRW